MDDSRLPFSYGPNAESIIDEDDRDKTLDSNIALHDVNFSASYFDGLQLIQVDNHGNQMIDGQLIPPVNQALNPSSPLNHNHNPTEVEIEKMDGDDAITFNVPVDLDHGGGNHFIFNEGSVNLSEIVNDQSNPQGRRDNEGSNRESPMHSYKKKETPLDAYAKEDDLVYVNGVLVRDIVEEPEYVDTWQKVYRVIKEHGLEDEALLIARAKDRVTMESTLKELFSDEQIASGKIHPSNDEKVKADLARRWFASIVTHSGQVGSPIKVENLDKFIRDIDAILTDAKSDVKVGVKRINEGNKALRRIRKLAVEQKLFLAEDVPLGGTPSVYAIAPSVIIVLYELWNDFSMNHAQDLTFTDYGENLDRKLSELGHGRGEDTATQDSVSVAGLCGLLCEISPKLCGLGFLGASFVICCVLIAFFTGKRYS